MGFWDDAPWGKIAHDRLADIIIEPTYPRGGLLGGSGAGKTSKLAALAKARKAAAEKKQQEASADSVEKEGKVAVGLLSKLAAKKGFGSPTSPTSPPASISPPQPLDATLSSPAKTTSTQSPVIPAAIIASPLPLSLVDQVSKIIPETTPTAPAIPALPESEVPGVAQTTSEQKEEVFVEEKPIPAAVPQRASPSSFALSMFGERVAKPITQKQTNGTLFYYSATVNAPPAASSKAFTDPSPDDMVITAQGQVKGIVPPFLVVLS